MLNSKPPLQAARRQSLAEQALAQPFPTVRLAEDFRLRKRRHSAQRREPARERQGRRIPAGWVVRQVLVWCCSAAGWARQPSRRAVLRGVALEPLGRETPSRARLHPAIATLAAVQR
ncbi:MAG: hypothetical protein LUE17_15870 [Planctomycetaceae bacterium]|nr:hypothetical protein [Planctomycetaceae bacterium]